MKTHSLLNPLKVGKLAIQFATMTTCALLSWSCQTTTTEIVPPDAPIASPKGQLSEGDLIKVTFPGAPDLNLTQKVLANGTANLPIIGDVAASGKKLGTFQRELEVKYREHLTDPRVLVSLETPSAAVYVSGEVLNPGKIPLERPLTVLDAIMEAGGFKPTARRNKVIVWRNENGVMKPYQRNLKSGSGYGQSNAFYLQPYDKIEVPMSLW